jgi:hypothetical protein
MPDLDWTQISVWSLYAALGVVAFCLATIMARRHWHK